MSNYTQLWGGEFQKNTIFIDRNSLVNVIEIGCFEGITSNYIIENLLSSHGKLICIDPLSDEYSLDNDNDLFRGQYSRFMENVTYKDQFTLIREGSEKVMPLLRSDFYDLIYVDGHHSEAAVYKDGMEAFRVCKIGGWVLFDDLNWGGDGGMKRGIEQVLSENPNHKLLLKLNQVLIQKLPNGSKTENGEHRYQELSIEKLFNKDTIYAAYCNLDERVDRNEKMIAEIKRVDWEVPIVRQRSYPWKELYNTFTDEEKERVQVMVKRKTPGAIGCWFSQMEVMKKALRQDRHCIILEDDLQICDDFPARTKIIFEFLNQREWDILYFGGTYHIEPTWHKSVEGKHTHPDLQMCNCILNRDWEETNDFSIRRVYGCFSTHAYMINKNRIGHILMLLNRVMPIAMGIDWAHILEQPNLNCFAFNPGCIKQYDNQSNIGDGISKFSGFRSLGQHWFSRSMNEYIPD